jgi:phosphatidylserine/phosphatidylglycerophosphate/cardiolipin synthase-like enzyme
VTGNQTFWRNFILYSPFFFPNKPLSKSLLQQELLQLRNNKGRFVFVLTQNGKINASNAPPKALVGGKSPGRRNAPTTEDV